MIRNQSSTRPWQHVLEPLSGYLRLGELMNDNRKMSGESFNFGPNPYNTKSVKDLVEAMEKYWPNSRHIFQGSENESKKEAQLLKLNCDKSYELLNWKPVLDFEKTIEITTKWYFSYYEKNSILDISRKDITKYTNLAIEKKMSWVSKYE